MGGWSPVDLLRYTCTCTRLQKKLLRFLSTCTCTCTMYFSKSLKLLYSLIVYERVNFLSSLFTFCYMYFFHIYMYMYMYI